MNLPKRIRLAWFFHGHPGAYEACYQTGMNKPEIQAMRNTKHITFKYLYSYTTLNGILKL